MAKERISIYMVREVNEDDLFLFYTDFEEASAKAKEFSIEVNDYAGVFLLKEGDYTSLDMEEISYVKGKPFLAKGKRVPQSMADLFEERWKDKCEKPCPEDAEFCSCRSWAREREIL